MFFDTWSRSSFASFMFRPIWVGLVTVAGVIVDLQQLSSTPAPEQFISFLTLIFGVSCAFFAVENWNSGRDGTRAGSARESVRDHERKAA